MSRQLPLPIAQRHRYEPKAFLQHAGVRAACDLVQAISSPSTFSSNLILGAHRSGKTHFLIFAFERLLEAGRYVHMWDAEDFRSALESFTYKESLRAGDVILLDDVHEYFQLCIPGASGPFVNFFEYCRLNDISILMSTQQEWESFPCDEHILSRLKLCRLARLGNPDEQSLQAVIDHLAKQRGMQLSERKLSYLEKRVGRAIEDIEACLDRVQQLSIAQGRSLDFGLLQDALR